MARAVGRGRRIKGAEMNITAPAQAQVEAHAPIFCTFFNSFCLLSLHAEYLSSLYGYYDKENNMYISAFGIGPTILKSSLQYLVQIVNSKHNN